MAFPNPRMLPGDLEAAKQSPMGKPVNRIMIRLVGHVEELNRQKALGLSSEAVLSAQSPVETYGTMIEGARRLARDEWARKRSSSRSHTTHHGLRLSRDDAGKFRSTTRPRILDGSVRTIDSPAWAAGPLGSRSPSRRPNLKTRLENTARPGRSTSSTMSDRLLSCSPYRYPCPPGAAAQLEKPVVTRMELRVFPRGRR